LPASHQAARPLVVYIDGGSRNNPGPAAIGVAVFDREELRRAPRPEASAPSAAEEGPKPMREIGLFIGRATNNVAEYRALLRGLEEAIAAGATEIEIRSDSELLVRQMSGEYRVKNDGLRPLHERALVLSRTVPTRFVHVPREMNRLADGLVNRALDEWEKGRRPGNAKDTGLMLGGLFPPFVQGPFAALLVLGVAGVIVIIAGLAGFITRRCPRCGGRMRRLDRAIVDPRDRQSGRGRWVYRCQRCGHEAGRDFAGRSLEDQTDGRAPRR